MNTFKKTTLALSLIAVLAVTTLIIMDEKNLCGRMTACGTILDVIEGMFKFIFILILIFPFSLITYRMREEVFRRWVKFSLWYIPILIIAMFLFPGGHNGLGVGGAINDSFDYLVLFILFAIYIVTSIVKIIRARRQYT